MKAMVCPCCGANDFKMKDGLMVCKFCGSKLIPDEDERESVKSFAAAQGRGKAEIDLVSDVDRLLEKCRKEPRNAKKYANLILDIDPDNEEVYKFL